MSIFSLKINFVFAINKKEKFKFDITKNFKNKTTNKKFKIKEKYKKNLSDCKTGPISKDDNFADAVKISKGRIGMKNFESRVTKNKKNLDNVVNGINLEIENFEVTVIKKEGITFVVYEHIKSGAKVIVYFKDYEESMDISSSVGVHVDIIPKDNRGIANVISQMLNNEMIKELRKNYDSKTLSSAGRLRGFAYPMVEPSYYGLGFDIAIQKWTPKIVEVIANKLKNPKFIDDNGKSLKIAKDNVRLNFSYSKSDWNNNKHRGDYEASKFFNERFVGGLFTNLGEMREIDNLNYKEVNDFYLENVVPANSLIIMSYDMNPNFKEILELMDKEYFKYFDRKNTIIENNNINELINTEHFRKTGVDSVKYITTDYSTGVAERKTKDDAKSAIKLTWNLERFSVQEQDVFRFMSFRVEEFIEKIAKELGYLSAKISYDDENRLFSLIFYSREKNKFEENNISKTEEDAKKVLIKIYEEISKADYEKLKDIYITSVTPDNILEYAIRSYRDRYILNLIYKSFSETREPFSKNFFDIEDNVILDDVENKRFLENIKNYKNVLERLINIPIEFIDLIYEEKKDITEYPPGMRCCFYIPINVKYDVLRNIVSEIIINEFLIPNIHEKEHVPIDKISCIPVHDKKSELKLEIDAFRVIYDKKIVEEIKNYLTQELPEKIENYVFTEEMLNKEKEKLLFSLNEELKCKIYWIEKERKILNNYEKIKKIALNRKDSNNKKLESLDKEIKENEKKLNSENIADKLRNELKRTIDSQKEDKKKYDEKNNLEKIVEEVKKEKIDLIKIYEKDKNEIEENLKSINCINLDDLKSAFQSIKMPKEIYSVMD